MEHSEKESSKRKLQQSDCDSNLKSKQRKISEFATDPNMEDCVELATIHGRPFTLFEDKPMQRILGRATTSSKSTVINSTNVKNAVHLKAEQERAIVKSMIKNKMICLKIDYATCRGRSFFGVTVQFWDGVQNVAKLLKCLEVYSPHTASNTAKWILEILKIYEVNKHQLLAITKDTARNLSAATRKLREELNLTDDDMPSEAFDDLGAKSNIMSAVNDEEEFSEIFETDQVNLKPDEQPFNDDVIFFDIDCAEHVLQLGTNKFLNESKEIKKTVAAAQNVAVKLRNPTLKAMLSCQNQKQAILMHAVRWSWTFKMMQRLLLLKEFCQMNEAVFPALKLPESRWNKIKELSSTLETVAQLTTDLQRQNLTIPDFLSSWKITEAKLKQLHQALSEKLLYCIHERENQIFENDLVIAGIYLDKRFSVLLNPEKIINAKKVIRNIYLKQQKVRRQSQREDEIQINLEQSARDEYSLLDDMLSNLENAQDSPEESQDEALEIELLRYEKLPRLSSKENVMIFWKNHLTFPILSQIAMIILTVPLTEVDVERLFSNLNFVLNSHRSTMTSDIVDDILIVRMNKKL